MKKGFAAITARNATGDVAGMKAAAAQLDSLRGTTPFPKFLKTKLQSIE